MHLMRIKLHRFRLSTDANRLHDVKIHSNWNHTKCEIDIRITDFLTHRHWTQIIRVFTH